MLRRTTAAWAIGVAFGLGLSCASVPPAGPPRTTDAIPLCEVLQDQPSFHLKRVRVAAILAVGAENARFYHSDCLGPASSSAAEYPGRQVVSSNAPNKLLDRLLAKDHRAWVVVEGIFRGREAAYVDPSLPEALKAAFAKSPVLVRYGHLGAYETALEIVRVLSVAPVSPETAW